MADLAGECCRGRGGVGLEQGEGAAVVRDIDVVIGDARACAVGAGPGDGEAWGCRGRGERGDGAGRCCGIDRVDDLRCGDGCVGVEDDARLGVKRRAGGESRLGLDRVIDVTLAVGRIRVGLQEPDERVGGRVERRRVERHERDREQAGAQVQARVDVDIDAERGRGIDPRAVRRQSRRHVDDITAEPDRAELERAPVEVRAELLGDDNVVRRNLGGFLVGELDRVGERTAGGKESVRAVARGAEEVVGVVGRLVVAGRWLRARETSRGRWWGWRRRRSIDAAAAVGIVVLVVLRVTLKRAAAVSQTLVRVADRSRLTWQGGMRCAFKRSVRTAEFGYIEPGS